MPRQVERPSAAANKKGALRRPFCWRASDYFYCLDEDEPLLEEPLVLPELPWPLEPAPELPERPEEPLLPEPPTCEPDPKDSEFWLRELLSRLP